MTALADEMRVEDRQGVRWLILDRPESRNGLTVEVVGRMADLLTEAAADDAVRVVVLTGANGAFCSGLDLKDFRPKGDLDAGLSVFHAAVRGLRRLLKPTIAAVDGPAAGFGGDLALGCDLRLFSETGRLGASFVRLGLMPDGGGTFWLPRIVGLGRTYELLYEGRMVEADEAYRIGLANHVIPREGFVDAVQAYAARLAAGPPLAYARIKQSVQLGQPEFERVLEAERKGQLELLGTADFTEGIAAFLEKRPPKFQGH